VLCYVVYCDRASTQCAAQYTLEDCTIELALTMSTATLSFVLCCLVLAKQVDLVTWVILLVVAFANTIRDVIVDATHNHSSHDDDKDVDKDVDKAVDKAVDEAHMRALAEAAGATKTAATGDHGISGGAAVKSFIAVGWLMLIIACIFYLFARRSELLLLKKVRD
jgi:hypothetical protein